MKKNVLKNVWRVLLVIVLTPIALFLLLAILIYIPPVQNFVVKRVASAMSESTGMQVEVGRVRLAFPLDLAIHDVNVVEEGDTVVAVRSLRIDVPVTPLFSGRADIDGFSLYGVKINTKDMVGDTYIRGTIGELEAQSHGVEWGTGFVKLDNAVMRNATIFVALSDTAKEETDTTAAMPWNIVVDAVTMEQTRLSLSMPGDTMRVFAHFGKAALTGGQFDLGRPYYAVRNLKISDGGLGYATRSDSTATERAIMGNIAFRMSDTFLWQYFSPAIGIDPNYITVSRLGMQLDSLSYDAAGTLRTRLTHLTFKERNGLEVTDLSGDIYMDSVRLKLPAFCMKTPYSTITTGVDLNFNALTAGRSEQLGVTIDANIGGEDVRILGKGYLDSLMLKAWPQKSLVFKAETRGNFDHLALNGIEMSMPGAFEVKAEGEIDHLTQPDQKVSVHVDAHTQNMALVKAFLPEDSRGSFDIPAGTTLKGDVGMQGERYTADLRMGARGGQMTLKADADLKTEVYDVSATATAFPLGNFVPGMGLHNLTGNLKAKGSKFDVLSATSRLETTANVEQFGYGDWDLSGINFSATSRGGEAVAKFASTNALIDGEGTLTATLSDTISATLAAELNAIDLLKLGVSSDTVQVGANVNIMCYADRDFTAYGASGALRNIRFMTATRGIPAKDLNFAFTTDTDTTTGRLSAGDLYLDLGAKGDVTHLADQFGKFVETTMTQVDSMRLDQETLRRSFPVMDLVVRSGNDNPLSKILYFKGISYDTAHFVMSANPRNGLGGQLNVGALKSGGLLLDTIVMRLYQDSLGLSVDGNIRNYTPKNPNKFEVKMGGYLRQSSVGANLQYIDSEGRTGIDFGLSANLDDNGLRIAFSPHNPVIAYRKFTVNDDNYIFLGKHQQLSADIDLVADDGTALRVYCEPSDSINDISVNLHNLNLGELSDVLPYLPRLGGMLSADLHVIDDHANRSLSVAGQAEAKELEYEEIPLGTIGMEAIYLPQMSGKHYANAYISSDNVEVMQLEASYSDSLGTFEGNANLHDFPLQMINGFLAGTDMFMSGTAGGELAITGTADAPILNGQLDLDSAHVYSEVYGLDFLLDERPVEIVDNKMNFQDYCLYSSKSENPLVLNGSVDFSDMSRMTLDFTMKADNFELVNAQRTKASLLYGKIYANYVGTLRGTTENMFVRGKLEILDRTDMTYILKDSPLTVDDRLNDLVKFVDFRDTTTVEEEAVVASGGFDLTLGISISDAARFRCNLSDNGESYVNLEGGGDLTMRLTQQGDMRITGRFTANSGDMKYSLPVIPLKTFTIEQGSYVDFTGDVMNPTLNITAKERVKATVTENDQPRTVTFDVGVAITKPLNNMGLEFVIEAPEDLTVQNELAAMSVEQRSKTAVAMLATGMYLTDESISSGSSGFKASNALNAFLQSEIQNIAGSALKTIDLSVGMESGTSSTGTETTDYSFQFSKRLWNNRVSIIIGGKVSTGEDAQNSAESFIDNIAIEYRLDKSATRYVKLFYDRSTQDPLEGQLTKTGAGLVLRRKTNKLGELFIFSNRKKKAAEAETVTK